MTIDLWIFASVGFLSIISFLYYLKRQSMIKSCPQIIHETPGIMNTDSLEKIEDEFVTIELN